jgi:hypothetical protein
MRLALPLILTATTAVVIAQGPPPMRHHTATQIQPLTLVPADATPPASNHHKTEVKGEKRVIESNGIPGHLVGRFPNHGNPNAITPQPYHFEIPTSPRPADQPIPASNGVRPGPPHRPFGVALNGVLFDPGTAEFWKGDPQLGWNYEALGAAVGTLGMDANHAHVQPTGSYHYHGLPVAYLRALGVDKAAHSPQVGWAADGFPIYALYGYESPMDPRSQVVKLTPSYRLKGGERPGGKESPGGKYDGAFTRDYEFIKSSGSLDECNGRFCVTPEFPGGTYAYFLTTEWPVIPRCFRGTPVELRPPPPHRRDR